MKQKWIRVKWGNQGDSLVNLAAVEVFFLEKEYHWDGAKKPVVRTLTKAGMRDGIYALSQVDIMERILDFVTNERLILEVFE